MIDYAINYSYIIEELCEQKDISDNDCKGKCYLTKQIKNQIDPSEESDEKIVIDFIKIPHLLFTEKNQFIKKISKANLRYYNLNHLSSSNEPLTPPPKY